MKTMRRQHTFTAVLLLCALMVLCRAAAEVVSPSALSSIGCPVRETELGDLVADAVRAACNAPIALVPAGSFREITIPKGKVKTSEVVKSLQYPDDQMAVIELTGAQLIRALERSVSIYPQKNMGFLQVSGLVLRFDPKASKGSRILSVEVGKEKLAADRKYRVATPKPLANGAYGYFTVWPQDQIVESKKETLAEAVAEFLSDREVVDYRKINRILLKE